MNLLTVSAVGLAIFSAYLIVAMYILRMIATKYSDTSIGQGLAALIH